MRRNDREINNIEELIAVMKKCDVCRLALFDEEYPYIVPLNFGMKRDGDQILLYFHGATEGKKYDLMAKNNKAGFEMDCSHRLVMSAESKTCTMEYESIIGTGTLSMVEDPDKFEALKILMAHYHQENFEFNTAALTFTKVFQLTVNEISGKKRMKKDSQS